MAPADKPEDITIHVLWINAGLSCDGDSVSLTAAMQPSVEDIALGALPGLPKVQFHWPLVDFQVGDEFMEWWWKADAGALDPFVLVLEGSIPNEAIKREGYWCGFGNRHPGTSRFTDQPMTTSEWIDRLAPKAWAIVCAGTCATYGGIHAMAGNPTGAMGVPDYLGWDWRSKAGVPIVCVPGCPIQPDNLSETLAYLLYQATNQAPMIPLDQALRPTWLFGRTVHEGCDRAGYYEQGDFAHEYGSPKCLVKLGCWGPVVKCNVPKRGWMNGIGGCPNVGGICIGCTMPGFPDKFMPFMDEPPGSTVSTTVTAGFYGPLISTLRTITAKTMDEEPRWRRKGSRLLSGYEPGASPTDSVTRSGRGKPEYSGKSITRRGEDMRKQDVEPGRYRTKPARAGERPGGKSTARDTTAIDPQNPIDDRMPNLRG
jgi:hydrogenase small subunit